MPNPLLISNLVPVSNSLPVLNPEPILDLTPISNQVTTLDSASILNSVQNSNSIPVSKTIRSKKNTRTESDIYHNNYCVKALRTLKMQNKSLAALGMLFLLHSLLPSSGGRIKVDRIVSATGMSKSNILAQLDALENVGLITTLTRDISGRLISFSPGIENDIGTKFEMGTESDKDSSCYFNKLKTTTTTLTPKKGMDIETNMGAESNTDCEISTRIGNDTEVNTIKHFDTMLKNKLHNNIVSLKFSAQEFFFVAKASKVGIDKLTEQCFKHYHYIKGNMGGKYANGLFLALLSKAKDNPTAYVVKAIQQGATASPDDEIRAENVTKAGESIFKEIGVDILRKDLENALCLLSSNGQSQETIQQECRIFVERMVSRQ
jgi:DNA-binding transcriptional ArsR family regulator